MHIGPHQLNNNLIVAPMAGVTDRPFRQLCKRLGAGMAVSEMVASDPRLWSTHKSRRRTDHQGEVDPISVQIAGADPVLMAEAAKHNVEQGAQIIDVNMGCPAKKVCNVAAGSALLKDEDLVHRILDAVVGAVNVPVTLKIRTGWDQQHRNAVRVARIAQSAGIRALAVHGRTRACGFAGEAEYATIAAVKSQVSIPVVANGDIDCPAKAKRVLDETGADAIMIGRAAQGRPWIFREISHYLATGETLRPPSVSEVCCIASRSPARTARLLRRRGRRADRAQAHMLVHQGAGWFGRVSPKHQSARDRVRAGDSGQALFRPAAGAGEAARLRGGGARSMINENEIARIVRRTLDGYFRDLDGEKPTAIYDMVISCVERPLIEVVLTRVGGNQTVAAELLGMNRNTLRKKIKVYGIKYGSK